MNPLSVEQQYQLLQQSLPLMASRKSKLLHMVDFLFPMLVPDNHHLLCAYAPELVGPFLRELCRVDLAGTPPSFQNRLEYMLDRLHEQFSQAAADVEWITATNALTKEIKRIQEIILRKKTESEITVIRGNTKVSISQTEGVVIPVVERELLLQGTEPVFAALRTVRVEIHFSRKNRGDDEILVDQVFDADGAQHRQIRQSMVVARRLLRTFSGIEDKRPVIVHCMFDEPNIIIGESLGTALTFAVFTELLHLYQHRETVALRPDVAVTGVMDQEGVIRAVDEQGLQRKVQACAYSWIRFLIVPREQEEAARLVLQQLAPVESQRPVLAVIGVSSLEDILYDRRLTSVSRIPLPAHTLRKIWRHRRSITVAVLAVAMLTVLRFWYGPLDKAPAAIEFHPESFEIQNRSGQTLEQVWVGTEVVNFNRQSVIDQRSARPVILADLDTDGVNEVVFVRELRTEPGWIELCCRRVDQSEPIWTSHISRTLTLPNSPEAAEYHFQIQGIVAEDLDGDRVPEIVALASLSSIYPTLISVIRSADGIEVSSYLHMGRLTDVNAYDIDGDTRKELVATGINNAFRSAAIVIIDPGNMHGMSPSLPAYMPKEYVRGTEKCYIILPRTILGDAFRTQNFGNLGVRVGASRGGIVSVSVRDFEEFVPELGQKASGVITMTFRTDLSIASFSRNEAYELAAEVMMRKKRIEQFPGDDYFAEYEHRAKYWNGEQWLSRSEGGWRDTSGAPINSLRKTPR